MLAKDTRVLGCPAFLASEGHDCDAVLQVKSVEDVLAEGDELDVMCLGRDSRGHVKVSRRALLGRPGEDRQDRQRRVMPMMGIAARS